MNLTEISEFAAEIRRVANRLYMMEESPVKPDEYAYFIKIANRVIGWSLTGDEQEYLDSVTEMFRLWNYLWSDHPGDAPDLLVSKVSITKKVEKALQEISEL